MVVHSRRLLRWSHLWSSSCGDWWASSSKKERSHVTTFCLFKMWCQILSGGCCEKSISWISSTPWEVSHQDFTQRIHRQIRNAVSEVEFSQQMHFLYRPFYVNMKNQHFFSWSCCYLGVLSKMTLFSLSISVHALWMCYNEQSLYLYLKKKLPKDIRIQEKA